MVYDPDNKPVNEYARAYAGFLEQTKDHTLTVILDEGLNRQMRVGAPNTGMWSWRVATWPGYLATFGDVADGFMFTRIEDMMNFFDRGGHSDYHSDGSPSIDFRYWAEKLSGSRSHDVKKFSSDAFIQHVREALDEHEDLGVEAREEYDRIVDVAKRVCTRHGVDYNEYLTELRASQPYRGHGARAPRGAPSYRDLELNEFDADEQEFFGMPIPERSPAERRDALLADARFNAENEHEAREWLRDNPDIVGQDAYWESELRDYNVHFIYACYAIELTVRLWRAYEASPEAIAHRNPGESYIHLEGGLIQNTPSLPVFNMDVLDSDCADEDSAKDALVLYENIAKHPTASISLDSFLDDASDFVRSYGSVDDVKTIEAHEANRLACRPKEMAS